jgi:hypothetical protein
MDAAAPALAAWLVAATAFHGGLEALQKEEFPAAAVTLETARRAASEAGLPDVAEWARLFEAEARLKQGGEAAAAARPLLRAAYAEARSPATRARALALWKDHGGAPKDLLPEVPLPARLGTLVHAARAGQNDKAEAILGAPLLDLIRQISAGIPELVDHGSMLTEIFEDDDMALTVATPPDPETGAAVVLMGDEHMKLRLRATVGPDGWVLDRILPHDGVRRGGRHHAQMIELEDLDEIEAPGRMETESAPLPEPTPELRAEITGHIARLGDRDPAVRADARARLAAIGRAALPALREAARADDPEIAATARELTARILGTPLP